MNENITKSEQQNIVTIESLSTLRFILLCILSFGLYEVWWIYKSWRFFDEKENLEMNSAVRTIFSIIFLIPLFNKIYKYSKKFGFSKFFSSILYYIGIMSMGLVAYLEDPYWLLAFVSIVFYIGPFETLNFAIEKDTSYELKLLTRFNNRQLAIIILGSILWVLLIVGILTPEVAGYDYY